jgi:hypothetical protein
MLGIIKHQSPIAAYAHNSEGTVGGRLGLAGPGTKNGCVGEGQQQFTQNQKTEVPGQSRETEKYLHGSHGAWNQE